MAALRRALAFLNPLLRRLHALRRAGPPPPAPPGASPPSVLVLGIYLADRPNTAAHLAAAFAGARHCRVSQAWVALNGAPADPALTAVTVARAEGFVPKFSLLNVELARLDWRAFDYVILCDDDVVVGRGFLDAFLGLQRAFDLALAQPARTLNSHADWKFVRRRRGIRGRRTRFVEIGPLVSMRSDFARRVLPLDETSPMGWGYDFVWPLVAEEAGLRIGIIDATPVDHSLRPQASAYDARITHDAMLRLYASRPHLSKQQAFTVLEVF